jgi:hypothetical protein
MTVLWHYTANSGNVAETGREMVDQVVIDRLLPVVDAQEGDLPEVGLAVDIMTPLDERRRRLPGAAFFQIEAPGARMSQTPYVMAVACWRADREADAWQQFRDLVAEFTGGAPNREPPDLPWLAVYVLPYALALPPETVTTLGDLERCLAWALIESE